jgi:hypothetical protein
MTPLKAVVKNGRLVLDEATELPEGTELALVPLEDLAEMTDDERAALHDSLRESVEEMNRGELIDANEALAELRAHR